MTPSGDMSTKSARMECFALTNIVPQEMKFNSGAWEHIEQQTRTEAKKSGELFVVTAPAFLEDKGTIGQTPLKIPSHIWKAIYNPKNQTSWAFICKNQTQSECKKTSIKDLETLTKIKIFSSNIGGQ